MAFEFDPLLSLLTPVQISSFPWSNINRKHGNIRNILSLAGRGQRRF